MADVGTPIPATAAMRAGVITGTAAMACVGSSAALSARLAAAPVLTAQAIRYAAECLLLAVLARATGRRLVWPRGTEWGWLLGTAVTGLALFNIALVRGTAHAEPAVFGVAVASVPLLLAVIAPVIDRSVDEGFLTRFQIYGSEYGREQYTPKLDVTLLGADVR